MIIDDIRDWLTQNFDKILHATVCYLIVLTLAHLYSLTTGIVWAVIWGILKELYDKYIKKTCFDWSDIKADIVGIIAGIVIWIL